MAKMNSQSKLIGQLTASLAQLQALQAAGNGQAETTSPAATTATPGWLADHLPAKTTAQTTAKTKTQATATVKPTWIAKAGSFNDVPGYYVVKMFGDVPNHARPNGKFVTRGEALAIFAILSQEPVR